MSLSSFTLNSNIKDTQNRILASYIKGTSNIELMRSEEAIRDVINSYTERFKATEGMLTDASKYVVKSKDIVDIKEFNSLFESLYVDLAALYNELETVDNVLTLNLSRNKKYYSIIKKRIKELWQRLRITRLNIYDLNPADESFYESFYSDVNMDQSNNLVLDKKLGFVYLKPTYFRTHNKAFEIKNIKSTVYPVENEEAGVLITTSELNNLSGNYYDGTKDMLENGLWKEEVSCSEVPDMIVNIGSSTQPLFRTYRGVVAVVDIEYTYPVDLNRLDLDIYGDKSLDIDSILYKQHDADEWRHVVTEQDASLDINVTGVVYNTVYGRGFDVLSFTNLNFIKAKHLRIVFNQKNYSFINTPNTNSVAMAQQVEKDLSERRYDLLKFNSSLEDELTTPVNEENTSLYAKILAVIESTRNLEDILNKISDILVPPIKLSTINFGKIVKFELGTWSIEPRYEEYVSGGASFKTKPFILRDRHLIGASLSVKQSVPELTTCNWYVSVGGKDIPIVEGTSFCRKEPINFVDMTTYTPFSGWTGAFALLDFPLDPGYTDLVGIYENGIYKTDITRKIVFLNSRLLYFPLLTNMSKKKLVIKYQVAQYKCCNLYILQPKPGETNNDLILGMCSSRRDILESFINSVTYTTNDQTTPYISDGFTITNALSTLDEAKDWFGESYQNCIFVDDYISNSLSSITGTLFENITVYNSTKTGTTAADITNHINGNGNLNILCNILNVVPLSLLRTI